jgi:hypothetical protein
VRLVLRVKRRGFLEFQLFRYFFVVVVIKFHLSVLPLLCYNLCGHVGVLISHHCCAVELSHNNKGNVASVATRLWAAQSWVRVPVQARDLFSLQNIQAGCRVY